MTPEDVAQRARETVLAQITATLNAADGDLGLAAQVWLDGIQDVPADQEDQFVRAAMGTLSQVVGHLLVLTATAWNADTGKVWSSVAMSMQPESQGGTAA